MGASRNNGQHVTQPAGSNARAPMVLPPSQVVLQKDANPPFYPGSTKSIQKTKALATGGKLTFKTSAYQQNNSNGPPAAVVGKIAQKASAEVAGAQSSSAKKAA
mmetsp:Transcript_41429/g.54512  ORF Transcript_41429/g.54512 Transcript_41429/m.54512 type:complete len:104 (-) Transcript_41429:428-739(-)